MIIIILMTMMMKTNAMMIMTTTTTATTMPRVVVMIMMIFNNIHDEYHADHAGITTGFSVIAMNCTVEYISCYIINNHFMNVIAPYGRNM